MPLYKKNVCAELALRLGMVRIIETFAKRNCLMVLNYHRIGDKHLEAFDEAMYSATGEQFEVQVSYLRRKFTLVTLEEAVDLVTGSHKFHGTAVLITFDDGYLDNYLIAFPILRSLQIQGTFFLISSYLENPVIPWWDRIAYVVRGSKQKNLRLSYPESIEFTLEPGRRSNIVSSILELYKSPKTGNPQRFIEELEAACSPYEPWPARTRLFMNLDEAREMIRGGMAVGSHTKTHPILSQLTREEQITELAESRASLSSQLAIPIDTLAYPVGRQTAFNQTTRSVLRDTGYRAAFSFYGGLNQPGTTDCLDIKRFGIESDYPFARFRLQTAGAVASGGYWF